MARKRLFQGPGDARIRRALCLVAHPDDIEFYCAGTVLLMTAHGAEVWFCVATSGDKGTRDADLTTAEVGVLRESEQRAAAKVLGAAGVEFLRHRDAELTDSLEFRAELVGVIRRIRPDVLLTFDPTRGYRYHPDHRVVGGVALDAAWPCARDPLTFPEQGEPWETAEAWCFAGPNPDLEVDVTAVLGRKIEARLEHRSQTGNPAALRHRWRAIGGLEKFKQVDLR
ncbi:MAG: PIG-L family deacetylase [Candidatus Dormibacteraceae bacterium]